MMNNEDLDDLVKDVELEEKDKNSNSQPIVADKSGKAAKTEKTKNNTSNGTKVPLVDFEAILSKDSPPENSDILLSIFEIATNPHAYGISTFNNSRAFWDKLPEVAQFSKILEAYKTETLRKYWRVLSEISNSPNKVIDIIKKSKDSINLSSLKLLTIISNIKDHIAGKIKNLEESLLAGPEKPANKNKKKKSKKDEESFDDAPKKMLNTKRKKEADVMQTLVDNIDMVNSKNHNSIVKVESENNTNGKRSTRAKTITSLFTDEDISYFSQIEIILQTFKNIVPEATEIEIWDSLKRNSFNIISAYLYLINQENYEGKQFHYPFRCMLHRPR